MSSYSCVRALGPVGLVGHGEDAGHAAPDALDRDNADRLWERSERLIG